MGKINTNSNVYTVIYATVLVVIVAAVLAFVSDSLRDKQQKNIDMETKKNILLSVNLAQKAAEAADPIAYIEEEYNKYITESFIVNAKGEVVKGDAFKVSLKSQFDIMRAATPDLEAIQLPVFVATNDKHETYYILSVYGAGLWGPIWGYISFKSDLNTIEGANFSHKGETPGLGAEIATPTFTKKFEGRTIFDNAQFTSIIVAKGGAKPGSKNEVDAITGGTITSKALESSITSWLEYYLPYIEKQQTLMNTPTHPVGSFKVGEVE